MKNLWAFGAVLLLWLGSLSAKAQNYQWATGVKFGGYENGLSVRYFGFLVARRGDYRPLGKKYGSF